MHRGRELLRDTSAGPPARRALHPDQPAPRVTLVAWLARSPPSTGLEGQQQWMAKTWDGPPLLKSPTAQTLLADVAATPARPPAVPGLGLATWVHVWPFQRSIRVLPVEPAPATAHALLAEVAVTP